MVGRWSPRDAARCVGRRASPSRRTHGGRWSVECLRLSVPARRHERNRGTRRRGSRCSGDAARYWLGVVPIYLVDIPARAVETRGPDGVPGGSSDLARVRCCPAVSDCPPTKRRYFLAYVAALANSTPTKGWSPMTLASWPGGIV